MRASRPAVEYRRVLAEAASQRVLSSYQPRDSVSPRIRSGEENGWVICFHDLFPFAPKARFDSSPILSTAGEVWKTDNRKSGCVDGNARAAQQTNTLRTENVSFGWNEDE